MTNRQPNNYLYPCGCKVKTNAIKENPVDESSCKSFSGLIHVYEVCKNSSVKDLEGKKTNVQRGKHNLKVVHYVFLPVKIDKFVHPLETIKMIG